MSELEFESNNTAGAMTPKAKISKGYYVGRLVSAKMLRNKQGELVENKWGPQMVLDFEIYRRKPIDEEESDFTVGKQVTFKVDNMEFDAKIPVFLNSASKVVDAQKNPILKDGKVQYKTAFTPKSRATQVLMALGWEGPPAKVRVEDYIGNFVEANVDDYTMTDKTTGAESVISSIKDVKKWTGQVPKDMPPVVKNEAPATQQLNHAEMEEELHVEEEDVNGEPETAITYSGHDAALADLKDKLDNGIITQKGYDMAIEQLNKKKGN